jgi:hypothetical protein
VGSVIWLTGALVTVIGAYLLLDTDKFHSVFEWAVRDTRLLRISLVRNCHGVWCIPDVARMD